MSHNLDGNIYFFVGFHRLVKNCYVTHPLVVDLHASPANYRPSTTKMPDEELLGSLQLKLDAG